MCNSVPGLLRIGGGIGQFGIGGRKRVTDLGRNGLPQFKAVGPVHIGSHQDVVLSYREREHPFAGFRRGVELTDLLDAVGSGYRVFQVGDFAFDVENIFPFQIIAQVADTVGSGIFIRLLVLRHVHLKVGLVLAGAKSERRRSHQDYIGLFHTAFTFLQRQFPHDGHPCNTWHCGLRPCPPPG